MKIYTILIFSTYFLCFITGCITVKDKSPVEYKVLLILMLVTILTESVAFKLIHIDIEPRTLYQFFSPFESACITYAYYRSAVHKVVKRIIGIILVLLPLLIISLRLLPMKFGTAFLFTVMYAFVELVASCIYMVDILVYRGERPESIRPLFWTACGMILFCCVYILKDAGVRILLNTPLSYYLILLFSNMGMYAGITGSFISYRVQSGRAHRSEDNV